MEGNLKDRIEKLKVDVRKAPDVETTRKINRWKKTAVIASTVAALVAIPIFYFSADFLIKRQNYAERNVLFRSSNVTSIAGNQEKKAAPKSDVESVTKVYEGGGIESKVGTYLFESLREIRGDIEYFNMDNSQKIRIASATQKPERFQAGIRLGGSMNYREEFAEIVTSPSEKAPQKYIVYKIDPERGWRQVDVDVVEFPVERGLKENEPGVIDKNAEGAENVRIMVNRLTENRNLLGWFSGKKYRDGTLLEDFIPTARNKELAKSFFAKLRTIDSEETIDKKKRELLIEELVELQESMDKATIYATFEDGFFKILPQDSTIYLGETPTYLERLKNKLGFGRKDHFRLRVENARDLFPGWLPILRNIPVGSNENRSYPFDKYNNGGYKVTDKFGEVAEIDIVDFWFFYGQDVLYNYYLDLNGDGKIDKQKELIGKVLCRTTHDEKRDINFIAKGVTPANDVTLTTNYSFMAPDNDLVKGLEYFKYCAYIESLIPDQVHRGRGKHSLLGFINDQRSDIMLFRGLNVEDLSRALTQESTLIAKDDIIKVLSKAKRPYAKELAQIYGVGDTFKGTYQTSELLKERLDMGIMPHLLAAGFLVSGGLYGARRIYRSRKEKNKEAITKKIEAL